MHNNCIYSRLIYSFIIAIIILVPNGHTALLESLSKLFMSLVVEHTNYVPYNYAIISRGLYIFYSIYHCGQYQRRQTVYDLNKEILQFLCLKSAGYNIERVLMARVRYTNRFNHDNLSQLYKVCTYISGGVPLYTSQLTGIITFFMSSIHNLKLSSGNNAVVKISQ